VAAAAGAAASETSQSFFCCSKMDCPPFSTKEHTDNYDVSFYNSKHEQSQGWCPFLVFRAHMTQAYVFIHVLQIRKYDAGKWVEVKSTDTKFELAYTQCVSKLLK
jgi:hypothetical protein